MKIKMSLNIFVYVMLVIFLGGCGKKYWPAPVVEQERFKFYGLQGKVIDNCIEISGKIEGNTKNLKDIALELEFNESCYRCPFLPDKKVLISRADKGFKISGNTFFVRYCFESLNKVSRIRLVGFNRFSQIEPVYSDIVIPKIEKGDK